MRPAILFDLDGTLLDSAADILASLLYTFDLHALERPDHTSLRPLIGRPLPEIYAAAGLEVQHHDGFIGAYRTHYLEHCADTTRPFPGVLEVLEVLRSRGYLLAVATAKRGFVAERVCAELGLTPHLDHIQGTDGFAPKPSPEVIHAALGALEQRFGSVRGLWMVGDTSSDIRAGQAAGLSTYGVTWGSHSREVLEDAGADVVSDSLEGLLEQVALEVS